MLEYICTRCEYVGARKKVKPGSTAMEVFLWTVLLVPGPFYTAWRFWAKKWVCPNCGESAMLPVSSKLGRQKLTEAEQAVSPDALAKIPDRWQKDREEYAAKMKEMLANDRGHGTIPAAEKSPPVSAEAVKINEMMARRQKPTNKTPEKNEKEEW